MSEQCINISNAEMVIEAQYFVHKDYSVSGKELLLDIFSTHYCGQLIRIRLFDGENPRFSGFINFIEDLCLRFSVDPKTVLWETHEYEVTHNFNHRHMLPGIFISTGKYIPAEFDQQLIDPKFVGMAVGRLNPTRLRLAYEIDQAFPNNNFTIFQPKLHDVQRVYNYVSNVYTKELAWLHNKKFDQDLKSGHPNGMIDWYDSLPAYPNIWVKYHVEIVSETDAMSDFWFTEKTARCLATGKPFVLVAGTGSLKRLQVMGFKTFDTVIDESYDVEATPTRRIHRLIDSLRELYNSPTALETIKTIAQENIEIYKHYCDQQ